ncbi:XRE family transcriptional regulator [uncultured Methanobrevibacter sp.]|jgi:transcriptional regulator with XRE-family HTH domain|uniref:XRE family transcriptional regulator n=1 Tax=uncultured Methanobrevibacter sp. TaxID=253161 RepID=UPI0024294460|nr:XRE family transcriptional regulator [uncultured Methanobrevibacter sp.]MBE6140141.1 helix-turn-helix transcriptional regulator [Bacillota bacterium]
MTNEDFGQKIKDIRARQDMSLEELSEKSGVKLDVLKAMEDGEVIPSLTPLTKMARALGVRLGTFLDDTPELGPVITRGGKTENSLFFSGREDVTNATNLEFHSLGAGKIDRNIDPFIIDITFEEGEKELSSHEGEEFIYVLEGEIEVIYGKDTFTISEGDTIFYDSVVPHHLHASGDADAKILAVLYTPY